MASGANGNKGQQSLPFRKTQANKRRSNLKSRKNNAPF